MADDKIDDELTSPPHETDGEGAPDPNTIKSSDEVTDQQEDKNEFSEQDLSSLEKVDEENCKTSEEIYKSTSSHEVEGIQFFEEKSIPATDTEFGVGKTTRDLNLVREETVVLNTFESETNTDGSIPSTVHGNVSRPGEDKKSAQEASIFWSVAVGAAALAGLAAVGFQWRRNKLQFHQLKQKLGISNERINRIMEPLNHIKDILAAGTQNIPHLFHNNAALRP